MRVFSLLIATLSLLLIEAVAPARAAEEFLPPEQAFVFSVRALDDRSVEIVFNVAEGYYLYREAFAAAADGAGVKLAALQVPPGKLKFDETFKKEVETYRGRVVIKLGVDQAPADFTLRVTSQGCADKGLCYPPMESPARVRLTGFGGDGEVLALTLPGAESAAPPSAPATVAAAGPTAASNDGGIEGALRSGRFWVVVGVFFAAGLLLSFTPCVLPMLPILSSIIVGQSGAASRSRSFVLSLTYSLGMALVYTLLGVAAGLAGEGLAATLQNPWVLSAFALMLTLLAMSMFGFYELQLPAALRNGLSSRSSGLPGGRLLGVFAMGGLSALIVSPCVAAPLAGALLYISQTRDVALGGSALFSLAAGMSVPLLLVGASAGTLLPRAGAWMDSVKNAFGVLLLGVAWWIVGPVLPAPLVVAGWGAVLLCAAVFLGVFDRLPERAGAGARLSKTVGMVLAIAGAVQVVGASLGATDPLQPLKPLVARAGAATGLAAAASEGVRFQRVRTVEELDRTVREAGRPVMLDFYADWCVSCKEMERFTFADPRVRGRLDSALLLQADVTANSPEDRALLKRFQLFGPPGILFFDARGQPIEGARVIGYQPPERFLQSLQAAQL
ncbi:MAG: protein-disulfide reductase DsbD [Variovorax sp.]